MHVLPPLNGLFCHFFPSSFSGVLPEWHSENIGCFLWLFPRSEPEIELRASPKTEIERDNELNARTINKYDTRQTICYLRRESDIAGHSETLDRGFE
jgi:hypothetical protein